MSDIGNGGFSCCPSIVIPQANVVIASNVLSTTGNVLCANIISGDGTFTGNLYVQGQILGTIIYNSLNVFALANIGVVQAGSIFGNGFGISNLNSSNLSGIIPPSLIYGNTISNIQAANISGLVAVTGNTLSNLNASNIAFGIVGPSLIYGNTLSNIQAANISGLVAVTGNTLSNLNASNIAFGIVSSAFIYGNTISNLNSANITQPFANLVVSNTVTTNNTNVQSTLQVTGAMTSNIANTTFYYDTFTIPYINTQVLNVGAITSLTTANVTTLNVQSLFANSMIVYGANTLNVVGISNLNSITANYISGNGAGISNLNSSNLLGIISSTLIFGNTLSNVQMSNVVGLTGNTLSNLNASNLAFGVVNSSLIYGNTISNVNSANIIQPFTNLTVTNTVTTTNIVAAGFTSNITNTVFNFDTLTIPFVNSSTLSVTGNAAISNALTTANLFASTVSTTNPIPFRNRIINGGMTVWQRNVASISTTASLYTTADRWCGALGTSGLLLSQWPGPTENTQFPYSLQVTTSTTTTGVPLVEQRIENLNIPDFINGTPVTVSFYAGQPYGTLMPLTVGLYYATAVNNFGTQTLAVAATQNTPTLTTANVQYSLTFTLTTSLGATNGLSLRFTTGGASAIGSTILLTAVQVEKGLLATPFEVRPYGTELRLAQRYYYQLTSPTAAVQGSAAVYAIFGTATGITTTAFWLPLQFPVPMRTPNYTFSNSVVTNFQLLPTGTTTITSVGVQSDSYTPVGATLNFVGTNIVPTASYIFRTNNLSGSTVAFFGFSCEL
jgi:CheY-specific phosphatase CheX